MCDVTINHQIIKVFNLLTSDSEDAIEGLYDILSCVIEQIPDVEY